MNQFYWFWLIVNLDITFTPKMHILEPSYSKAFTKANKKVLLSKVARGFDTFECVTFDFPIVERSDLASE
ncbi:MAG: hypothetical protein HC862_19660 [Scytonema sp. RU_4_4]|nr:hypothetical protein [Scytonema sp. RU_4_4]